MSFLLFSFQGNLSTPKNFNFSAESSSPYEDSYCDLSFSSENSNSLYSSITEPSLREIELAGSYYSLMFIIFDLDAIDFGLLLYEEWDCLEFIFYATAQIATLHKHKAKV